jgi:aminoglycoside 6'-N-acetyltransferase
MLSAWLSTPHVRRWWDDDPSIEAIEKDYGGCVDGTEPAEVFIARFGVAPVGLMQRYRFGAYPQYMAELAHLVDVPAEATSIDYLIGPEYALGRGLGTAMIAQFVQRIWRDDPSTPSIVVPVQADNRASWRSLERAGFTRVAQGDLAPDNPVDRPLHFIYRTTREG